MVGHTAVKCRATKVRLSAFLPPTFLVLRAIGATPAVVEDKESAIELERTKRIIIEFRGYDETRIFVGNIWNLRIRNRLSNSFNDCKAEARIFHNGFLFTLIVCRLSCWCHLILGSTFHNYNVS
jgi:hypothetical protein